MLKLICVFFGLEGHTDKLKEYNTIVIDAQYYSEEEIQQIKNANFETDFHRFYTA